METGPGAAWHKKVEELPLKAIEIHSPTFSSQPSFSHLSLWTREIPTPWGGWKVTDSHQEGGKMVEKVKVEWEKAREGEMDGSIIVSAPGVVGSSSMGHR